MKVKLNLEKKNTKKVKKNGEIIPPKKVIFLFFVAKKFAKI